MRIFIAFGLEKKGSLVVKYTREIFGLLWIWPFHIQISRIEFVYCPKLSSDDFFSLSHKQEGPASCVREPALGVGAWLGVGGLGTVPVGADGGPA